MANGSYSWILYKTVSVAVGNSSKAALTRKKMLQHIQLYCSERKKKHITVSELWKLFKGGKYEKLSDSKKTAYNIAYKKIENELCYRNIDKLNVTGLQQIVDEKVSSYDTKRDIKNLLSHLYKIALQDDFCDRNKAAYIILPELNTEEREIFSDNDIKKLWGDYDNSGSVTTSHMRIDFCEFFYLNLKNLYQKTLKTLKSKFIILLIVYNYSFLVCSQETFSSLIILSLFIFSCQVTFIICSYGFYLKTKKDRLQYANSLSKFVRYIMQPFSCRFFQANSRSYFQNLP